MQSAIIAVVLALPALASAQWTHLSAGAAGGYDYPIRTFWNGSAWSWTGTLPDLYRPAAALRYQMYSFEVTGPGRITGLPDPFTQADLAAVVGAYASASGYPTHLWNDYTAVVTDGSLGAVQVLVGHPFGLLTEGSLDPAADGPGGNAGHGLFSVVFPPYYNRARVERYPVLFFNPGSGQTGIEVVLSQAGGAANGSLMAQSLQNGGRGLLIVTGNAGGQGSQGLSPEYAQAVDALMTALHDLANADTSQVVTWGGSRGGSNALLHASRPGRSYQVVAAFAEAPPVRYGSLASLHLSFEPVHDAYPAAACWADPGCADGWRWNHVPPPATEPNYLVATLTGTTTFAGSDAVSPRGYVAGFDGGAWVEICTGPRDYVSGAGLAEEYLSALPAGVSWRLDRVYGSAHGGFGSLCSSHLTMFLLDRLARNQAYVGRFAAEVAPGVYNYRLPTDGPNAFCLNGEMTCIQPLPDAAGCGTPPAVALLPWKVQRVPTTGATEPTDFVILGQPGRLWRLTMTSQVGGGASLVSWSGTLGASAPPGCAPFPDPATPGAVRCTVQGDGSQPCQTACGAGCQGACGWRFEFDCNGDGLLETIDSTFTPFRGAPPAQTWLMDEQCYGFAECTPLGLNPFFGFPISITPCLNPASTRCEPAAYTPAPGGADAGMPPAADAGTPPVDAGPPGADAGGGRGDAASDGPAHGDGPANGIVGSAPGGCGCSLAARSPAPAAGLSALALLAVRALRRRRRWRLATLLTRV